MAHIKAGGSAAHQKANVVGKHRGLKVNQGQFVRGGQILVKQTGIVYKPGLNTMLSRDSSVMSRVPGTVMFSYLRRPNGVRTVVNIIPKDQKTNVYKVLTAVKGAVVTKAAKAETKVVKKEVVKKAAVKKVVAKKAK
jgi:ribosomal protein L27